LAAVETLMQAKAAWSGTLVALFQPAEETFEGAQAMVDDKLYDKIPKPTILLAQHSTKDRAGRLLISGGPILTACDSYDIQIRGRGGHGSSPDHCLDPIITAAHALVRLQTIVSREISPHDFAVVTCGSFKGGHTASIIPDTADFQLDTRGYNVTVMTKIRDAIKRIVHAECAAAGMEEKPEIKHIKSAPPTVNDTKAAKTLKKSFRAFFGNAVLDMKPDTASEDFSLLAEPHGIPYVYWDFGTTDPQKWDEAEKKNELDKLPGNHSSHFCPVIGQSLRTGTDAMALAALTFLGQQDKCHLKN
jgi:amidohydrolase